jgi:cytochrome c-type biogenesis protein
VAALAVDKFRGWFGRFRQWMPWIQRISGAVLILVGLLLVSGEFTRLAGWLSSLTPDWLFRRL